MQDNPARLAHQVPLDVQESQDKDLQDHLGLQVSQVMEDQDLRATKEIQVLAQELQQEAFTVDSQDHQVHLDHLGLLGLKDQQVCLDQEDTKVNKASQVCQAAQEDQEALREWRLMPVDKGSLDHQVHQGHLDLKDHKDIKGTLELLVFLALQEAPSQFPKALLVPQVLLVLLAIQAPSLHLVRCASTSPTI